MKTEKKIPLSKALSLHYRAFQVLQKNCPGLLPSIFFHSAVGAVLPMRKIPLFQEILHFLSGNGEHGADHISLNGRNSPQPFQSRSPNQVHHHRLRIVIRRMGGGNLPRKAL